jgi:hypothetical protein
MIIILLTQQIVQAPGKLKIPGACCSQLTRRPLDQQTHRLMIVSLENHHQPSSVS